ncbi:MAG: hypothetical protein K8R59_12825 [Thermoanaerobaculales bacterium]|nr:hypothetical protein [Thermoanaerobaculales bacterium]
MAFTVKAVIKVLPRPQLTLRGVVGEVESARLLVRRVDGKPLEIKDIKIKEPGIDLVVVPVDLKEKAPRGMKPQEGDLWLVATIVGNMNSGNRSVKAWISTNHPKMPELEIPVSLRIRPIIEVRPSAVQLFIQETGGGPRGTLFRVSHNKSRPFDITGIKVADEDLVGASVMDPKKGVVHSIMVELPDALAVKDVGTQRKTEIVIQTSDPEMPELTIPVTVIGRQPVTRSVRSGGRIKPTLEMRPAPMPLPTGTVNPS